MAAFYSRALQQDSGRADPVPRNRVAACAGRAARLCVGGKRSASWGSQRCSPSAHPGRRRCHHSARVLYPREGEADTRAPRVWVAGGLAVGGWAARLRSERHGQAFASDLPGPQPTNAWLRSSQACVGMFRHMSGTLGRIARAGSRCLAHELTQASACTDEANAGATRSARGRRAARVVRPRSRRLPWPPRAAISRTGRAAAVPPGGPGRRSMHRR